MQKKLFKQRFPPSTFCPTERARFFYVFIIFSADNNSMKRSFLLLIVFLPMFIAFSLPADQLFKSSATASYYADKFHGRKTSNGEIFNMYSLTAAHKTLPFNTIVKVTNLRNGKTVNVRINDRGPFVPGREIDLSKAAAVKLDMIGTGTATVSLEIISNSTVPSYTWKAPSDVEELRWDIQVGAYAEKGNADAMAHRLVKAGFTNVVLQKTKTVTRVALKDIRTDKVQSYLDKLEAEGFTDYFVRQRR